MYAGKERENQTGIPDRMKSQFEQGSGLLLDDVRVHYNSTLPRETEAYAYTQGNQVYLGPGQEKHLGHELGHVVQQKQGLVRPTGMVNGMPLNDDAGLERGADRMAEQWGRAVIQEKPCVGKGGMAQGFPGGSGRVVQRKVGFEFQVMGNKKKILDWDGNTCNHGIILKEKKEDGYKITADMGDYEYVTDAVDERKESEIKKLVRACNKMADGHGHLKGELEANDSAVEEKIAELSPEEEAKERGRIQELTNSKRWPYLVGGEIFWLPQPRVSTAHPQATVGIKIEKLGAFVEKYIQEARKKPRKEPRTPENSELISYLSNGGSMKRLQGKQEALLKSVSKNQGDYKGSDRSITDGEAGFLSLLAIMIQGVYEYYQEFKHAPWNAKSAMPLMPRTSLYDAFLKLPDQAKERIRNIGSKEKKRTPILKFISGFQLARKIGNTITFRQVIFPDVLTVIIAVEANGEVVTLGDWLGKLSDAENSHPDTVPDILGEKFISVASLYGKDDQNHNLYPGMKRSTDIGYDETDSAGRIKEVEGMLIEIRNMQRAVPIEEWKDVVGEVAKLTCLVNTGKLPGEEQQPRQNQVSVSQGSSVALSNEEGQEIVGALSGETDPEIPDLSPSGTEAGMPTSSPGEEGLEILNLSLGGTGSGMLASSSGEAEPEISDSFPGETDPEMPDSSLGGTEPETLASSQGGRNQETVALLFNEAEPEMQGSLPGAMQQGVRTPLSGEAEPEISGSLLDEESQEALARTRDVRHGVGSRQSAVISTPVAASGGLAAQIQAPSSFVRDGNLASRPRQPRTLGLGGALAGQGRPQAPLDRLGATGFRPFMHVESEIPDLSPGGTGSEISASSPGETEPKTLVSSPGEAGPEISASSLGGTGLETLASSQGGRHGVGSRQSAGISTPVVPSVGLVGRRPWERLNRGNGVLNVARPQHPINFGTIPQNVSGQNAINQGSGLPQLQESLYWGRR